MVWRASTTWPMVVGVVILIGVGGYFGVVLVNDSAAPGALLLVPIFLVAIGVLLGVLALGYLRTSISLDDQRLRLVVPTWHGQFGTLPMREFVFGPGDLRSVEIRQEVKRTLGSTTIGPALLVETNAGERIFAYRCTENQPGAMPLPDIAASIGQKMNCPVNDHGMVNVGAYRTGDDRKWDAPSLDPVQANRAKSSAARYAKIITALFAIIVALRACVGLMNN